MLQSQSEVGTAKDAVHGKCSQAQGADGNNANLQGKSKNGTANETTTDEAVGSFTSSTSGGKSLTDSVTRSTRGNAGNVSEKRAKKDRSNLRKGKWTREEEEYTIRIIHHSRNGGLKLPEGATLRSYLADTLNCDPMRITKKFAGASLLGKRAYHFTDR